MKKIKIDYIYLAVIFFLFYILGNYSLIRSDQGSLITRKVEFFSGILLEGLYYFSILILGLCVFFCKFRKKFYFKLVLIHIIYCIFSYLVTISMNINNPNFNIWSFNKNHLLQYKALLPVLLILSISILSTFIYRMISPGKRGKKIIDVDKLTFLFSTNSLYENFFLSQFFLLFCINDSKITWVISNDGIFNQFGTVSYFFETSLAMVFVLFIIYLSIRGIEDIVNNRGTVYSSIVVSIFFGLFFNVLIQMSMGLGVGDYWGLYTLPGSTSFQIITIALLSLFIYFVLNRFLLASILLVTILSIFTYANFLKFSMRSEPILPSDLAWLLSPKVLLSFVSTNNIKYLVIVLLVGASLYIGLRKFLFKQNIFSSKRYQITSLTMIILACLFVHLIFSNKKDNKIVNGIPILSKINNNQDITWMGNTTHAHFKSLSFVWLNQLTTQNMQYPKGYNQEKIKSIEKKYKSLTNIMNQSRSEVIEKQTVIYVLSESFADPRRIDGVSVSENPIPNTEGIKNNVTSGLMKSDGYGGGTANMEFQTLTGLPFYNLSQSVSVIYTEVVPKMNKFPSISDQYNKSNKIAIHLESSTNYARNVIYEKLGFKDFITQDTKNIKYENEGYHPSDASTYQFVLNNMNDNGQFFSVISMQNHSPWAEQEPSELKASNDSFSSDVNDQLTNYTRLLYHTDVATKDFLDQLSKINKKITVVFYGDHLPGLYPQSTFKNNPESQYLTDYFVWSNYETPKLDYPIVNSSDFTALLLEQTNSKVSPYYALLTEVLHKASVDKKDLDEEGRQIAEDLKLVQYDMVAGKGYLSKDFFKVHSE